MKCNLLYLCLPVIILIINCSNNYSHNDFQRDYKDFQNQIHAKKTQSEKVSLPKDNAFSLTSLIHYAKSNNSYLKSLNEQIESKTFHYQQDEKYFQNNPKLSISPARRQSNNSNSFDYEVELSQSFDILGQSNDRASIALLSKEQAKWLAINYENHLINQIKYLFNEYLVLQEEMKLLSYSLAINNQAIKISEKSLNKGAIVPLDFNSILIEKLLLENEISGLKSQIEQKLNQIKVLSGISLVSEIFLEGKLAYHNLDLNHNKLFQLAIQHRVELISKYADIKVTERKISLSSSDRFPEIEIGIRYAKEEDSSIIGAGISFLLPVFNNNSNRNNAYQHEIQSLQNEIIFIVQQIEQDVKNATINLNQIQQSVSQYEKKILSIAKENMANLKKSWNAGQLNALAFIQHQRQSLDAQKQYYTLLLDYFKAIETLENSMGCSLEDQNEKN